MFLSAGADTLSVSPLTPTAKFIFAVGFVRYNFLNLLENVSRNDTTLANYSYLADGTKYKATNKAGQGLLYTGSFIYLCTPKPSLESAPFSDGRFVVTGTGSIDPRIFVTDHLGSVRAVVNNAGEILEQNDYYPFGLRWADTNSLISDNRYRYNGKEDQTFVSLPFTDYGARMYNPTLGRWFGIDQLAERHPALSPYAFSGNTPIRYSDVDGRDWWDSVMGVTIGVITDVIPINIRDSYTPTDAADYNNSLQATDAAI